ncbi:MAG TPA: ATP-binding protein [Methylocystis sp.]|nr:ATP-binding protein [Methylocystis sp.]
MTSCLDLHDPRAPVDANAIMRVAFEAAPNGAVIVDGDGAILHVNAQLERDFGYDRAELVGEKIEVLLPDRDRGGHVGMRMRFMGANESRLMGRGRDLTGRRKDGAEFPIEIGLNTVKTPQGPVVIASVADISERKATEERLQFYARELEARNKDLSHSNQELDDFAYIASHDLKEPLRGIHNYASFLNEDYADKLGDDGRAKLATIARLAQRLEELIDTLLIYSRVGRVDLALQETNLDAILCDVLDSLAISLKEKGVEVRVPEPLPRLYCDGARVAEVFRNLVSNALKYNDKPDKWVEIGFERPLEGATRFYVRDNGVGIREKHLDHVFRIFKRLHARDQYGGGAGAGLAIVKKIVERHRGRIWVESVPGEGSVFRFTLQPES